MANTYTDQDQKIVSSVNDEFEIELPANPTTGYIWRPLGDVECLVVTEGTFQSPSSTRAGASGRQRFVIRPVKPGTMRLKFEYIQPWEQSPDRVCEFEIQVS